MKKRRGKMFSITVYNELLAKNHNFFKSKKTKRYNWSSKKKRLKID